MDSEKSTSQKLGSLQQYVHDLTVAAGQGTPHGWAGQWQLSISHKVQLEVAGAAVTCRLVRDQGSAPG